MGNNTVFQRCRKCNKPIWFIKIKKSGKKCPVDIVRDTMRNTDADYVLDDFGIVKRDRDFKGFIPHFATCKNK